MSSYQSSYGGSIGPNQLNIYYPQNTESSSGDGRRQSHPSPYAGQQQGFTYQDPYTFKPGFRSSQHHLTPQHVLNTELGTYQQASAQPNFTSMHLAAQTTELLPRPSHIVMAGESCTPIPFSVGGVPGPRITDVLRGALQIDGENSTDLEPYRWRTTVWSICWPGYRCDSTRFSTLNDLGKPLTRKEIALMICHETLRFMQRASKKKHIEPGLEEWQIGKDHIIPGNIRLVALRMYRTIWIPEFLVSF